MEWDADSFENYTLSITDFWIKVKCCILLAKQMTQYENKKTKSPMSQHSWLIVPSSLSWFPKIQNFYIVELKIFFQENIKCSFSFFKQVHWNLC